MITVPEHFGYKKESDNYNFSDKELEILNHKNYSKTFERPKKSNELCYRLFFDETNKKYKVDTSYIIGIDWIIKGKLPIYVTPKLNDETHEVNYLKMLFEALQETENINHLDNLYKIDFKAPLITIEQQQDVLSPLLIIEFLTVLKQIVKKGLKKSYYDITKNLNTKVKGKVLINATVKSNHTRAKLQYNYCKYQEFGYNSLENRLLKKTLEFAEKIISNHKSLSSQSTKQLFNFVSPAFENVSSDINVREVNNLKYNPFFKEYKHAIKIAKVILKRFSYNISQTNNDKYKTPPFWIDMPKLFELYVFKKLKEVFSFRNEVVYHKKFNSLEPDILLNSKDGEYKVIIDAKYKPRYESGNIYHNDAAQVSGYGRLNSIRKQLKIDGDNLLADTLIIYTSRHTNNQNITKDELLSLEDKRYTKLYKYAIQIPTIN